MVPFGNNRRPTIVFIRKVCFVIGRLLFRAVVNICLLNENNINFISLNSNLYVAAAMNRKLKKKIIDNTAFAVFYILFTSSKDNIRLRHIFVYIIVGTCFLLFLN